MLHPQSDAHDAELDSPSAVLSERAMTALRCGLQAQFRHPSSDFAFRHALRAMCAEARAKDLHAEQLIVLFKRAWHTLPEARGKDTRKKQELLDRLISLCVEEYYAT